MTTQDPVDLDYHRILGEWAAPHESLYVDTRFGQTHILASGNPQNPPLVLLHGAVVHAGTWGYNVPAWCSRFRV